MNIKFSLSTALFVLSLLPLLAYPAVLVANAMQLSALTDRSLRPQSNRSFFWQRLGMTLFLGGTTAYPLIVLVCWWWARTASDARHELLLRAAPLGYLGVLGVLLHVLLRTEKGASG